MNFFFATLITLSGLILQKDVVGLKLTKIVIPRYKLRGESAILECQYELETLGINKRNSQQKSRNHQHFYKELNENKNHMRLLKHVFPYGSSERNDEREALYSVKWYKDNEEFYRYVPKASPSQQSFRIDGIRVEHQHSDSKKVFLRGLTLKSTGVYRCEISAEAPNFSSVQGEARMDIVFLPRDGPHIYGREDQYQIGDLLNLNCTSGKSHPASHLQWLINDETVIQPVALVYYPDIVHPHGLITSTLGLQLILDARHFQDGALRVKCVASISPVFWRGGMESIVQRKQTLIDNREAMLLVLSSSQRLLNNIFLLVFGMVTSFLKYMTIKSVKRLRSSKFRLKI